MDQQNLILILTIFVGLATLAMIIQAAMLVALFLTARQIRGKIFEVAAPITDTLGVSRRSLAKLDMYVDKFGNATSSILDTTKGQVDRISSLLDDASVRAKVQMERAELVLDDTMTRVQTTASYIQSGVLRPVREVHGIFAGVRTALMHLSKPGRATVDHATADEEMFI